MIFGLTNEGKLFSFCPGDPYIPIFDRDQFENDAFIQDLRIQQHEYSIPILPIVFIAKELTKMKVEQLALTLDTSAIGTALPVMERPGQPQP